MQKIEHCLGRCWSLLETVYDPEIPVLSVVDLGMIRGIDVNENQIVVRLTPTYSGCPATQMLQTQISEVFTQNNLSPVKVVVDLSEAWTTDWLTQKASKTCQIWHCTTKWQSTLVR